MPFMRSCARVRISQRTGQRIDSRVSQRIDLADAHTQVPHPGHSACNVL